jgi:hypothetical protein
VCGKHTTGKDVLLCWDCFVESKKPPVSKEELSVLVKSMPVVKVAEKFGVSDNGVRKWCRKYGLTWNRK